MKKIGFLLALLVTAAWAAGCGAGTPQVIVITATPVPATQTAIILVVTATSAPASPTTPATDTPPPSKAAPATATATSEPFALITPDMVSATETSVPVAPTDTSAPPPTVPRVQPTSSQGGVCNLSPGNAGILVINDFGAQMTFTIVKEYYIPPHSQLLVQYPGGKKFTFSASVPGVGTTNGGPVTLNAGECVKYEPTSG